MSLMHGGLGKGSSTNLAAIAMHNRPLYYMKQADLECSSFQLILNSIFFFFLLSSIKVNISRSFCNLRLSSQKVNISRSICNSKGQHISPALRHFSSKPSTFPIDQPSCHPICILAYWLETYLLFSNALALVDYSWSTTLPSYLHWLSRSVIFL